MPRTAKPASPEIGVFTRSRERFLRISRALDEPCVWLGGDDPDYAVVIIDGAAPPPAEAAALPEGDETPVTWSRPGLVVYQCTDSGE